MVERKKRNEITKEKRDLILKNAALEGVKIKDLARSFDVDRRVISNILRQNKNGEIVFKTSAEKRKETNARRRAMFSQIDRSLHNIVSCDNSLIIDEMKDILRDNLNVAVSNSTISRKLNKIGVTRKILNILPVQRNTQDNIDARAIYASEISHIRPENLVFLDELGFNNHTKRSYGYSTKNSKAYYPANASKSKNISLLCAITLNGCIAYEYKEGSFNSDSFSNFILNQLVQYFRVNRQAVLVMDNARIHHSRMVINILQQNNIPFKFLPPYSPQLNPIEEFFAMIKSKFTRQEFRVHSVLMNRLDIILSGNYNAECLNFFNHSYEWVEKARAKIPFI